MASLGIDFDANKVDPSAPRVVIPAGKYSAHIIASEMKENSAGTGSYLSLTHEILDGEFKGSQFWNNLNLFNPNDKAVEIAQRDLSAICRATGQMRVTDSDQLHFKPILVTIKVRPAGPDKSGVQREAQNEVGGYEALSSGGTVAPRTAPAQTTAQPRQAAPATTAAASKAPPPWARPRAA